MCTPQVHSLVDEHQVLGANNVHSTIWRQAAGCWDWHSLAAQFFMAVESMKGCCWSWSAAFTETAEARSEVPGPEIRSLSACQPRGRAGRGGWGLRGRRIVAHGLAGPRWWYRMPRHTLNKLHCYSIHSKNSKRPVSYLVNYSVKILIRPVVNMYGHFFL